MSEISAVYRVVAREYRRHVFKKSFIMAVLSVPLMVALSVGVGWLTGALSENRSDIGYVDHAGVLADPLPVPRPGSSPDDPSTPKPVPMIPYSSEAEARAALESGRIQAYYVISPNYYQSNRVELVYLEPPDGNIRRQFWDFMQINRLRDLPESVARRVVSGPNLIVRWPDGGREFSQHTFLNSFLPLIVGVAFGGLLFMSSGYLMGAVVEEKENRMVEVLMTSLSAGQLMAGKIVGVVLVSLTQFAAWVLFAVVVIVVGGGLLDIQLLQSLTLDVGLLVALLLIFLPSLIMIAGLMTALGASVTEAQEAQQASAIFILPVMGPLWLAALIMEHPNGPLALLLSLFPLTSLGTYSLRLGFGKVPAWQLALSAGILTLCAIGAIWFAGKAFRLGMLRYGRRLDLSELLGRRA
jgi:ABC-2 type transport system permease protein